MSNISLKDYIKQETLQILDYCEEVENIAEGFEIDVDRAYDLIEGIEEDVAEAINSNEYYQGMIREWIMDEIKDRVKKILLKEGK